MTMIAFHVTVPFRIAIFRSPAITRLLVRHPRVSIPKTKLLHLRSIAQAQLHFDIVDDAAPGTSNRSMHFVIGTHAALASGKGLSDTQTLLPRASVDIQNPRSATRVQRFFEPFFLLLRRTRYCAMS